MRDKLGPAIGRKGRVGIDALNDSAILKSRSREKTVLFDSRLIGTKFNTLLRLTAGQCKVHALKTVLLLISSFPGNSAFQSCGWVNHATLRTGRRKEGHRTYQKMFSLMYGFWEYMTRKEELRILILGIDKAGTL